MSDERDKSIRRTSRLLGDLESIRSLLEAEEDSLQAEGSPVSRPEDRSHGGEERSHGGEERPHGGEERPHGGEERSQSEAGRSRTGADEDVPLLEDVVRGGVSVKESFLSGEGHFEVVGESAAGLDDELFKALLSDEWRESARDLLDQARAVIEKHQTEWTPAHTDELNQALRVRIDDTVDRWLKQVVQERIDDLRRKLLEAVADELHANVDFEFAPTPKKHDEDPDGA